jgi:hypothetical protein
VDLKPLHLVAFVQKFETGTSQEGKTVRVQGEVLQAVQVPVTGELVYPDINPDHPEASPLTPPGQKAAVQGDSPAQDAKKQKPDGNE